MLSSNLLSPPFDSSLSERFQAEQSRPTLVQASVMVIVVSLNPPPVFEGLGQIIPEDAYSSSVSPKPCLNSLAAWPTYFEDFFLPFFFVGIYFFTQSKSFNLT